jgi:hypothetical protein
MFIMPGQQPNFYEGSMQYFIFIPYFKHEENKHENSITICYTYSIFLASYHSWVFSS